MIHTFGRVLEAIYKQLDSNGIDMPYPTNVTLFHDQTEEVDGDRSKQLEDWPAGKEDAPNSGRKAGTLKSKSNDAQSKS